MLAEDKAPHSPAVLHADTFCGLKTKEPSCWQQQCTDSLLASPVARESGQDKSFSVSDCKSRLNKTNTTAGFSENLKQLHWRGSLNQTHNPLAQTVKSSSANSEDKYTKTQSKPNSFNTIHGHPPVGRTHTRGATTACPFQDTIQMRE